MKFLVQVNENGIPVTDLGYHIIESVKYHNWYNSKVVHTVEVINRIGDRPVQVVGDPRIHPQFELTPVGNIEFVEQIMQLVHKKNRITVINIPEELMTNEFTARKIWVGGPKELYDFFNKNPNKQLFVKSNTVSKGYTDIISKNDMLNIQSKSNIYKDTYFISEVIDIKAEWRVFVFRGDIIEARQYSGDWYDTFDVNFIQSAVKTYKKCPPAYTLDIARLTDGRMAVIEVHNFISCGLYGFENYKILPQMVISAYKYEIK